MLRKLNKLKIHSKRYLETKLTMLSYFYIITLFLLLILTTTQFLEIKYLSKELDKKEDTITSLKEIHTNLLEVINDRKPDYLNVKLE